MFSNVKKLNIFQLLLTINLGCFLLATILDLSVAHSFLLKCMLTVNNKEKISFIIKALKLKHLHICLESILKFWFNTNSIHTSQILSTKIFVS